MPSLLRRCQMSCTWLTWLRHGSSEGLGTTLHGEGRRAKEAVVQETNQLQAQPQVCCTLKVPVGGQATNAEAEMHLIY